MSDNEGIVAMSEYYGQDTKQTTITQNFREQMRRKTERGRTMGQKVCTVREDQGGGGGDCMEKTSSHTLRTNPS